MSEVREIEMSRRARRMMVEGSCATPGKSRNEEEERFEGLSSGEEEKMRDYKYWEG